MYPFLGSLFDAFSGLALDTVRWDSVSPGAVTVVPSLGMVQVACATTAGYRTLSSTGPYNAVGGALQARVTPVLRGNGGTQTLVILKADDANTVALSLDDAGFRLLLTTGDVPAVTVLPTYDPTAHAWWRLREEAGVWYAEGSADGWAWSVLGQTAVTWSPAAVSVVFQTHTSGAQPDGLFAGFQRVNTMADPEGSIPTWPRIRFQVAWNQGANGTTLNAWTDLSDRLYGQWSATLAGRQYEMDQIQSGQMSCTLWNRDGALDPLNTASPYAPYVLPLRPCRLQAVWPQTRNALPQDFATAASLDHASSSDPGTLAVVSGIAPAPTWHTTAFAWSLKAGQVVKSIEMGPGAFGGFSFVDPETVLPVVAGSAWSLSAWVTVASGDPTTQVGFRLFWFDITGTHMATTTAPAQSIGSGGTWTQIGGAFLVPDGAVQVRVMLLNQSSPATATVIYTTAWQWEPGQEVTPWAPGGAVEDLWSGYVERWPQQWDYSGTYGLVDITAVDALAALAQFDLQANFLQQIENLHPTFVYPFNELEGADSFADASGREPPRVVTASPLGAGGSITAGASVIGSGSVGSAGPVVTIANTPVGSATNSTGLYLANSTIVQGVPVSGAWARMICFRTESTAATGSVQALWSSVGPGFFTGAGYGGGLILGVDSSSRAWARIRNADGTADSTVTVPNVVCSDGNWHVMIARLSADGKTFNLMVDGQMNQVTTTGDFHNKGLTATDSIGAVTSTLQDIFQQAFSGDIAFATQFDTLISDDVAVDLSAGFSVGWAGETSASRAQRILTMAGYYGGLNTVDASMPMGPANFDSGDAVSALQIIADTEAGQVYSDRSGVIQLVGRKWRYFQTAPAVVFGEDIEAGEVPYRADAEIEIDDTHIYNSVDIQGQALPGAPDPPPVHLDDTVSQQDYLPRKYQRTVNAQVPTVPLAAAQLVLSQYAQPLPRVGNMVVDCTGNPSLMARLLRLEFGTRAQVVRRPPDPAPAVTVEQFVENMVWSGSGAGGLRLTLQMNAAQPYNGWWVLAAVHTTLAVASTAGAATVTLAALPGSATNPAAVTLPKGMQMVLGYGTAAAETVTVQSVAATVPGYATVAVTLTGPTVHDHAAGETFCQPIPDGLVLPDTVLAGYPQSLDAAAMLTDTTPRIPY